MSVKQLLSPFPPGLEVSPSLSIRCYDLYVDGQLDGNFEIDPDSISPGSNNTVLTTGPTGAVSWSPAPELIHGSGIISLQPKIFSTFVALSVAAANVNFNISSAGFTNVYSISVVGSAIPSSTSQYQTMIQTHSLTSIIVEFFTVSTTAGQYNAYVAPVGTEIFLTVFGE